MKTKEDKKRKSPPAENVEFGNRVRKARQVLDLTLDGLSRLTKMVDTEGVGISKVTLSRYENGGFAPGLRELKILSQSLRMPISYLVYDAYEDPMNFKEPGIEDAIQEIVLQMLESRKLVETRKDEGRRSQNFEALLEKARRG